MIDILRTFHTDYCHMSAAVPLRVTILNHFIIFCVHLLLPMIHVMVIVTVPAKKKGLMMRTLKPQLKTLL